MDGRVSGHGAGEGRKLGRGCEEVEEAEEDWAGMN